MTDRSSKERSRFEKWWESEIEEAVAGMVAKSYARDAWMARAALEDRQEAAPNAIGEVECRYCLRKVSVYRADVDERKLCESCWKSAHPEEPFRPGVPSEATKKDCMKSIYCVLPYHHDPPCEIVNRAPSEATPSKENAPPSDEVVSAAMKIRDLAMDLLGYEHVGGKIATGEITFYGLKKKAAPEVQGTPTNENEPIWRKCELCGRENSLETWAKYLGKCPSCHGLHDRDSTVGTPQKETPTMPYGAGAQNFAVKTYAETADQIRAATFVGTDKFVQTDTQQLPASVPEGVQGKEPKTFEEYWEIGRPDIRHLSSIQQIKLAEVRSAFSAGGAAGRRSAITEMQALQPDGYAHRYHDGIRYGVDGREINGGKPIEAIPLFFKSSLDKWRAELQEKTK